MANRSLLQNQQKGVFYLGEYRSQRLTQQPNLKTVWSYTGW